MDHGATHEVLFCPRLSHLDHGSSPACKPLCRNRFARPRHRDATATQTGRNRAAHVGRRRASPVWDFPRCDLLYSNIGLFQSNPLTRGAFAGRPTRGRSPANRTPLYVQRIIIAYLYTHCNSSFERFVNWAACGWNGGDSKCVRRVQKNVASPPGSFGKCVARVGGPDPACAADSIRSTARLTVPRDRDCFGRLSRHSRGSRGGPHARRDIIGLPRRA